ncbi:hypothetical protein [Bacterioplanoides sp.]|uniref:hypothetical protein n=1 Tax=Bacterioplanoides sp. TaxID=2066072 RepID=UPI003B003926
MSYNLHKVAPAVVVAGLVMMLSCVCLATYSGLVPPPAIQHIDITLDELPQVGALGIHASSCGFSPE